MNERINELFGQALDEAVPETWTTLNPAQLSRLKEKFAELIVQECIECADIVGKVNLTSGYPNSTAHHIKQKIKEHFGVEE